MKDLRPYTCTFKDCDTGGQLYDSLTDWLSHEVQLHEADRNQRSCPFCFTNAGTQHIAEHMRRFALFALPRSTDIESDSDEEGSANAQLAPGSKDSELSSLEFSFYDSGGEIDVTKHRIPGAVLNIDVLKALPGKTEERLLDYLSSDQDNSTDINAQGGGYGNALQTASSGDHAQMVQTLLEKGVEVNDQSRDGKKIAWDYDRLSTFNT
ncbi:MAG: hypothetical protein Q9201_003545 [Fulgogasparrea decipioides]